MCLSLVKPGRMQGNIKPIKEKLKINKNNIIKISKINQAYG